MRRRGDRDRAGAIVDTVEKHIGYTFTDKAMLLQSLTHRSYTNEHYGASHNERLEFLGDAVLQFIVTQHLYTLYPDVSEGELSVYRSLLVKTDFLVSAAKTLHLPQYLRVSRGQKKDVNTVSSGLYADAVEALIGAVYLDGGLSSVQDFILKYVLVDIPGHLSQVPLRDAKTALQEYTQRKFDITPKYVVLSEQGPDHAKVFAVEVQVGDVATAESTGKSKRDAEQNAAQKLLDYFKV